MLTDGVGKRFQHASQLIQHRFNFVSTRLKTKGEGTVSLSLFNKIERMSKPFCPDLKCLVVLALQHYLGDTGKMLAFEERENPEYPEKHLSVQKREPTNSTHI